MNPLYTPHNFFKLCFTSPFPLTQSLAPPPPYECFIPSLFPHKLEAVLEPPIGKHFYTPVATSAPDTIASAPAAAAGGAGAAGTGTSAAGTAGVAVAELNTNCVDPTTSNHHLVQEPHSSNRKSRELTKRWHARQLPVHAICTTRNGLLYIHAICTTRNGLLYIGGSLSAGSISSILLLCLPPDKVQHELQR